MLSVTRVYLDHARDDAYQVRDAIRAGKALDALVHLTAVLDALSDARLSVYRTLNNDFEPRVRDE
jgi:hypothetical protein